MKGMHVYDGDTRVKFVRFGFLRGVLCSTFSDYNMLRNRMKVPETGGHVLLDQRV